MEKKINSEEVKTLLTAIDDLITIKVLIRKVVPNYDLDESLKEKFTSLLKSLQKKLQPIFLKYLKQENISESIESTKKLKETILELMSSKNFILISSNSSKKKLKNIGIDPRNLIVSGGPLFFEDYKIVNPNLPDTALSNIKNKCEKLLNQIKNENWSEKDLIFIYEKDNPTDKLILNRLEEISDLISKKIQIYEIKSWKDLET